MAINKYGKILLVLITFTLVIYFGSAFPVASTMNMDGDMLPQDIKLNGKVKSANLSTLEPTRTGTEACYTINRIDLCMNPENVSCLTDIGDKKECIANITLRTTHNPRKNIYNVSGLNISINTPNPQLYSNLEVYKITNVSIIENLTFTQEQVDDLKFYMGNLSSINTSPNYKTTYEPQEVPVYEIDLTDGEDQFFISFLTEPNTSDIFDLEFQLGPFSILLPAPSYIANTQALLEANITLFNQTGVNASGIHLEHTNYSETDFVLDVNDVNLMSYWKCNNDTDGEDNTNIKDHAGLQNGTFTAGAFPSDFSKIKKSCELDGTDDFVDLGTRVYIDAGGPFTIMGWVYLDDLDTNFPGWVDLKAVDAASNFRILFANFANYDNIAWGSNTAFSTFRVDLGDDFLAQWHHLALVYNGNGAGTINNFQLYRNGVNMTITTGGAFSSETGNSLLGIESDTLFWDGKIDDTSIWNRTLTFDEVKRTHESSKDDHPANGTAKIRLSTSGAVLINNTWVEDNVDSEVFMLHPNGTKLNTSPFINIDGVDIFNFSFVLETRDRGKSSVVVNYTADWSTVAAADSCSPDGTTDHTFQCSDACFITSTIDFNGNDIIINGSGTFTTSANITNFKVLDILGCNVNCILGGCFV